MSVDPNAKSGPGWEEKLHDASVRVEDELRRVITYLNDEVVPEVRKNSSAALRAAAQQMQRLAEKMDERTGTSRDAAASHNTGEKK